MLAQNQHYASGAQALLVTSHRPKLEQIFVLHPHNLRPTQNADSQIKIARGTIQTPAAFLLGVSADLRG